MNSKFKKLILSFLLIVSLTGCSALSGNDAAAPDAGKAPAQDGVVNEGGVVQGGAGRPGIVPPDFSQPDDKILDPNAEQKLVKTATVSLAAKDIQRAQTEIDILAKKYKGYIFSMNQTQTSEKRYLTITIKVATEHFDAAIADIKNLGMTSNVAMDVQDVTTQFIDTEARIKTLKVKEQTLTTLLTRATEIEDILAIETNLQQTRQEIEASQGKLNSLTNATSFSRITINVSDETGLAATEEPQSLWERLRANFSSGIRYWGNTAVDIVSGLIFLLPILIPLAVILFLLARYRKRHPSPRRIGARNLSRRELYSTRGSEAGQHAPDDQTPSDSNHT